MRRALTQSTANDDARRSPTPSSCRRRRPSSLPAPRRRCAASFRPAPGVYLFQDQAGRVLYIGKAKNLRARAGSYFLAAAADDQRTSQLVREAYDVDFVEAESEVDALLMEARLVKDIQPKYNRDLRDDKSFPYLQITTHEDFPRVEVTREPRTSGVKLYGPFANAGSLRGAVQVLQKVFKFRTCSLDIEATTSGGGGFGRACWRRSISARRRAICGSARRSTARTSSGCGCFWKATARSCSTRCGQEMAEASAELRVRAGGPAAR